MTGFDPKVFGAELAIIVKEHVAAKVGPLERRIAALEAQAGIVPPSGKSKGKKHGRAG